MRKSLNLINDVNRNCGFSAGCFSCDADAGFFIGERTQIICDFLNNTFFNKKKNRLLCFSSWSNILISSFQLNQIVAAVNL
jgi:hypothetical protein